MRGRWLETDRAFVVRGIPARSRTEPPSFGRSSPQSGGTGTSGLPARNRTWATGFVDRCSDSTETGRDVVSPAGFEPASFDLEAGAFPFGHEDERSVTVAPAEGVE